MSEILVIFSHITMKLIFYDLVLNVTTSFLSLCFYVLKISFKYERSACNSIFFYFGMSQGVMLKLLCLSKLALLSRI